MSHVRYAALAVGLVVAAGAPARADEADAKAAKALVDKAIKAHGGADNLAKFTAYTAKFKGTFHGMGMAIPMTGEIATQGADKVKVALQIEAGGQTFAIVNVFAGDKGWLKVADQVMEMSADQLAEAKEQTHAGWVASLVPLIKGTGYTLATTGEQLVNDKPALGVKVTAKGHRDVTVYFDKESGLVAKHEVMMKDEGTGQEVTEETFPTDYKDQNGTKQAAKTTTKRDGKLYMEAELTELQLLDKVDPGTFAKP
ncbi:MAG: hypothetical protein K2X87_33125 [Gemmataceae bacterium]|nr:hypothetical protein [Gemmataceae bacterium]